MATILLTIPDAQMPRVVAALCATQGLSGADVTGPNAKAALIAYIKTIVEHQERQAAVEALQVNPVVLT